MFTTPWSREKKGFLHLVTTFTTPWSREKKRFFSFNHYVHYNHNEERKFFFHLVTTFTTPWSKEKNFFSFCNYVHNTMIKRKKFFSFSHYVYYAMVKKNLFFSFQHYIRYAMVTRKINWLLLHHYLDYTTIIKKFIFLITTLTMQVSSCISLRFTNEKVSKRYPPKKNMSNLKTFFLRNFGGVLHDLLPVIEPLLANCYIMFWACRTLYYN